MHAYARLSVYFLRHVEQLVFSKCIFSSRLFDFADVVKPRTMLRGHVQK